MGKLKTAACVLYAALILGTLAVPGAMLLRPAEDDGAENRKLAEFPAFRTEDGEWDREWSKAFQAYVSDHFGFRKQLVTADSSLKYNVLHMSSEEDVIVGKDGWLYYTPTVKDYIGNPTVSGLGICNIRHNLEMLQAYAEGKGARFAVMVVPNKNTVYPAYMPYPYVRSADSGNLPHLKEAVDGSSICWCPCADVLQNAASGELLYHKTDTHWNNAGALAGYCALLDTLGIEGERYADAAHHTEQIWEGDLQKMLFPESGVLDDQTVYDIAFDYSYQGRYKSSDDITIQTKCDAGDGKLLMFRDSFGAAIIPYLSEQFAAARYSRARPYPVYVLESEQYDAVVVEIVERNIAWLQREAPMHPAPSADAPAADQEGSATLYTETSGDLLHFYGKAELPDGLQSAPDYYFTLQAPDGGAQTCLAYNCYESELFGEEEVGDNGYSLYIPMGSVASGTEYTASLTVRTENGVMRCDLGTVTI